MTVGHRVKFALAIISLVGVTPTVYGQTKPLEEPETCTLNALRGVTADATQMVRFNCIRSYLKAADTLSQDVGVSNFDSSTGAYQPEIQAFPTPIQASFRITVKNNTPWRLISADVIIAEKNGSGKDLYHAFADYPIDPNTVGHFSFDVNINTTRDAFQKNYFWQFMAVYGLKGIQQLHIP